MALTKFRASLAGIGLLLAAFALSSCDSEPSQDQPPPPIGDFRLGHTLISEDNAERAPISREAGPGLLKGALEAAMTERLKRYRGSKWYHLSISIGAYSLTGGGIPVLASPRAAMVLRVTVWDDATATKLNEEPHVLAVLEPTSPETIFGSGLVRTPEEQAVVLAKAAARQIEYWLGSPESPLPGVGAEPPG